MAGAPGTTQCPKCGFSSSSPEVCDRCGALLSRILERQSVPPETTPVHDTEEDEDEEPGDAGGRHAGGGKSRFLLVSAAVAAGIAGVLFFRSIMPPTASTAVAELDKGTFETRVLAAPSTQTWFIDLWAPWCGPCRQFGPEFSAVAESVSPRAYFAKVNVDDSPEVARQFQVQGIPTVLVIRGGKEVQRLTGGMSRGDFRQWVDEQLKE